MVDKYDFDQIQLISHDAIFSITLHANCWYSRVLNQSMHISHARKAISTIPCSKSLQSVYAPDFNLNLIGECGVDNDFVVPRISIMCPDLDSLQENKILRMLDHFDMTSKIDECISNSLLNFCLLRHDLPTHLNTMLFASSILGWYNDMHCTSSDSVALVPLVDMAFLNDIDAPLAMSNDLLLSTCFDLTSIHREHVMMSSCASMLHRRLVIIPYAISCLQLLKLCSML